MGTSAQPRTSHGIADHEWRCWPLHKNAMAELAHIGMCGNRMSRDRYIGPLTLNPADSVSVPSSWPSASSAVAIPDVARVPYLHDRGATSRPGLPMTGPGQPAKRSLDHARSHPPTAILIVLDCHSIRPPRSEAPGRADLFVTGHRSSAGSAVACLLSAGGRDVQVTTPDGPCPRCRGNGCRAPAAHRSAACAARHRGTCDSGSHGASDREDPLCMGPPDPCRGAFAKR
jgi:hypothetical protein